jgi:hypothetical protein
MKTTKRQLLEMIQEAVMAALEEGKFDPSTLRKLNYGLSGTIDYVRDKIGLRELGAGSSRTVFAIDSKRALKLASNKAGIAQNEAELATATDKPSGLVAKILQYDPESKWLVSELVRPLDSEREFQALTGVPWGIFSVLLQSSNWEKDVLNFPTIYLPKGVTVEGLRNNPFLKTSLGSLQNLQTKLLYGDLSRIEHWGKTPDQRVVLLDYGYTDQVRDDHYAW